MTTDKDARIAELEAEVEHQVNEVKHYIKRRNELKNENQKLRMELEATRDDLLHILEVDDPILAKIQTALAKDGKNE